MRLKSVMAAAWGTLGLVIVVLGAVYLARSGTGQPEASSSGFATEAIGGPFTMENTDGETVTEAAFEGSPTVLFFGFTHCPDICPTTLYEMTNAIDDLGSAAEKLDFVFVTVDPERDTPEIMARYLDAFDDRIEGLTGTPEQLANMAAAYRIHYERVPTDSGYTMNHTASIYLMDSENHLADVIAYGADHDTMVAKMRALAAGA